ncbi:hypothetical protein C923_00684 [Plasmodium falciparum UGT5.1]|uniref:Uncharacterized protein n=1 Tax=Plasmodium falciparum UGT5.1 TaxID=1237627 RepID=W7JI40_PLAFA|nr:hypothetical protein C923_00684 [Plasmodium falciparum UGT5.1]
MKKRKMLLGSSKYWQLWNQGQNKNKSQLPKQSHIIVKMAMVICVCSNKKQQVIVKLNPELVSNGGSSIIISVGSSKKHHVIVKLSPES